MRACPPMVRRGCGLLVLALAACGGGDSDPTRDFAAAMSAADPRGTTAAAAPGQTRRRLALPTTPGAVDADAVLDWAEYKYASLFPRGPLSFEVTYNGTRYTARAYVGPWGTRYLGITPSGSIFGLGDFTNNALQGFGVIGDYAGQVVAERCAVYPGACASAEPSVPLNGCTMPASQALVVGTRLILNYETTGTTTATLAIDSVVDGPAVFEGANLTRISSTTTSRTTFGGSTITATSSDRSYVSAAPLDYTRYHGAETTNSANGFTSDSKSVFTPPHVDLEFGLAVGQSLTATIGVTSTTTAVGLPPSTVSASDSITHTFEGTETITVRGRSYSTCRYSQVSVPQSGSRTTSWFVVGKGIPVRTNVVTSLDGGGVETTLTELVSGTINGAPL